MVRKLVLSLIAVLGVAAFAIAQNKQVSGTVTSADGNPVAGATVVVEGTTIGTSTGVDGKYAIQAPADAMLIVSFIGFETQSIPVAGKTQVDIVLKEDATAIDDVIVVAFGTSTKEAFTGSASVVKSDDIEKRQVSNVAQALAGAAAGVQVTSSSGNPTSTPTILIRGISSISAGKEPLYVVDGVPYAGDLNLINPADIASLTVLKDAASTALYGSRGANGVIMITTKKAKMGEATVTFDAKVGVNARALKLYDYVDDPREYYELHYKALNNYYLDSGMSAEQAYVKANTNLAANGNGGLGYMTYTIPEGQYAIGRDGKFNPNATKGRMVEHNGQLYWLQPDNWVDEAYRTTLRQEYNVNVAAATDRANFYASMGYLENNGIVDNSNFQRYSARLKADYQAKKWLKVGMNAAFSHYETSYLSDESSAGGSTNVFNFANTMAPIYPVYVRDNYGRVMKDANGFDMYDYGNGMNAGLGRPSMPNFNALMGVQLDQNRTNGNSFSGTAFADFNIYEGLTATFNVGTLLDEYRQSEMNNPFYGQFADAGGMVAVGHGRSFEVNAQQLINYDRTFADKHHVHVMLGHEFYRNKVYSLSGAKSMMFSYTNLELNGAVVDNQSAGSKMTDYNTEGYFARGEYDYDGRIFVSGSYRRDASSKFHPDNRWGNFWSASAAWLINKESWFKVDWVDMLKVKASYGSQGNDGISSYLYTDQYSVENAGGALSVVFGVKGNKNITWETNTNFNMGVDFELFKGRLGGTIEYFNRKTTDMLFSFSVAPSSGYSGYYANVGDMANRGFEIDLHGTPIQTEKFRWDVTLNMGRYSNEITYLDPSKKTLTIQGYSGYVSGSTFVAEGLSLYTWYMPQYAGVDPETGLSQWWMDAEVAVLDENEQPVVDAEGKPVMKTVRQKTSTYSEATQYLGDTSLPDLYGGFTTSFSFYGFDVSAAFAYQIGGKSYDSGYAASMGSPSGSLVGTAYHRDLWNAWTPENPNSNVPRFQLEDTTTAKQSDRFLMDASYLNISNITVGYTLPQKWTRKIGINNARIYLACDNVYYWSRRQGFDPRYSYSGSTNYANYSPMRTISGGVNLKF